MKHFKKHLAAAVVSYFFDNELSIVKVDKRAMIRNRYNRIPHPDLNTKRERNTNN